MNMSPIKDDDHTDDGQQMQSKLQNQHPASKNKKKDDLTHRYQSGMRPSIVTTINNTNPNNNDPSIPTRVRQRANEPYESYIEDSFVGHWEHEDDAEGYQEDFDAESHDGYDGKSELNHPSTIEFDFDSFGPESIIYSPSTTTPSTTNATTMVASQRNAPTVVSSRPPPLMEVSTEAENAGHEESTSAPTDSDAIPDKNPLPEEPTNEIPIVDAITNPSSSSGRGKDTDCYVRAFNQNFPAQEYIVDPAQIDLKVIEPYKKVISHAGYCNHFDPSVPGEPTPPGQQPPAVIVFSACYLPDRSRRDYNYVMDHLFLYVLTSLHELIADDYILIYLHNTQPAANHSSRPRTLGAGSTNNLGTSSDEKYGQNNLPTFTWMKRCYQMIDRRLRKNLRILYLVKPTFWLKTIVIMCKPFISAKFSKKLRFVEDMNSLRKCLPVDKLILPASAENI